MDKESTLTNQLSSLATEQVYQYQTLDYLAVIGAILVMIIGMFLVNNRLKGKNQGYGPNALKALGVVLFLPLIVVLAILSDFKPETLSVLLGTVAGYVLSGSENNSNSASREQP